MRQTRIEIPADEKSLSAGHPGLERFKIINEMLVEQSLASTKSSTTTLVVNLLRCVKKLGGLFRYGEFRWRDSDIWNLFLPAGRNLRPHDEGRCFG
jgi:hypothetical protein